MNRRSFDLAVMEELGKHLRARRELLGLRRSQMALRSGVSQSVINSYEYGTRATISPSHLRAICHAYETSISALIVAMEKVEAYGRRPDERVSPGAMWPVREP